VINVIDHKHRKTDSARLNNISRITAFFDKCLLYYQLGGKRV
jgi:hypothetical protein